MSNWFDNFQELFNRDVKQSDFDALFKRVDITVFFSYLNNLWGPNELLKKVGGRQNIGMLYKDPDIYAAIDKRIAALMTTNLNIEGSDPRLVEFFNEQIRPHERQLKQDLWWSIFNGYGVEQIIYEEDMSGRVKGFQKEEFWRFEPMPDLIHVKCVSTDNAAIRNKILPYGKWVLTTNNGTSSNPFGDMMAERLITPWYIKCTGWDLWIDFAKRFANGFMHGRIEDMAVKDEFRTALEAAGKSSVFVTDKSTELTLTQPNRDSSLYSQLDDKTVSAINRVILGETLTSDTNGVGSQALGRVHNGVREEKTWADITLIEKGLNEIIRQIGDVNDIDPSDLPKATLSWDPDMGIEQVNRDAGLYNMGIRFTKEYISKTYGIQDDQFEIKEPEAASPWGFSQKGKKSFLSAKDMADYVGLPKQCGHKLNASDSRKSRRQEVEREEIVDVLMRNSEPPLNPDDLIAAILSSNSEKELEEKLTALFDTRNNQFADDMTKALYYAAARGAMYGNPESLKDEEE